MTEAKTKQNQDKRYEVVADGTTKMELQTAALPLS